MRLVNWNVERPSMNSKKNPLRVRHLLSLQPDIAILTETSRGVDLGTAYIGIFTEPSPRKPGIGEAVAAIWLNSESVSFIRSLPTSDPREAVCIEVEIAGEPYIIYASIIPYHGYRGPDGTSPQWEEHKKAIQWHSSDWQKIRSQFSSHFLITAGDYNQNRDGVGKYGSASVRDLLTVALDLSQLSCVTEQDFVATSQLSRRNIDHVCVDKRCLSDVTEVAAWEGTIANQRLSDHNGITVEFRGR